MSGQRNSYPADLRGDGLRVGVVASRFNPEVTTRLVAAATEELGRLGVSDPDVTVVWVPGAFELPLAAQRLAAAGAVDAVVALGAVIRGETDHNVHVAGQCAAGLSRVSLDTGVPVAFGVLTVDHLDQALARASGSAGEPPGPADRPPAPGLGGKGAEAAASAVEMARVLAALDDRVAVAANRG
ncbi:MAG: 6,7-dimethyl-8-ribityllumazine synthase [Acidimicrobiales bacterium]